MPEYLYPSSPQMADKIMRHPSSCESSRVDLDSVAMPILGYKKTSEEIKCLVTWRGKLSVRDPPA